MNTEEIKKGIQGLAGLSRRQRHIYYIGHLAKDIYNEPDDKRKSLLLELRKKAWEGYEGGITCLFQSRVSDGAYIYYAIGR